MRAEPRVFVEQIRLLLGNVGSSVVPAYLLALLMAVGLATESTASDLRVWCLAVIVSKTVDHAHARYYLRGDRLTPANARGVYLQLLVLHTLDAVAWASLALVTLSSASMTEFMLVNSVLAGIAGSSMSLLAPVVSVFIAFVGVEFLIVAWKFWQLGDASYQILNLALVLYFCSLSMQARNSCSAALAAIRLRFENTGLLARLQEETGKALAAHQEAVEANLASPSSWPPPATTCASRSTRWACSSVCWKTAASTPNRNTCWDGRERCRSLPRRCSAPCWISRASRLAWSRR